MSVEKITAEMAGDPLSPLIGMTVLTGDDVPKAGTVYWNPEDAMVAKSIRLPEGLYELAIAKDHPLGFSGVARDALIAYLSEPNVNEIRRAVRVLENAVNRLETA